MILLDRDSFREGVFKRDHHKCVVCKEPAVDAHHIIERKLFPDGGYYLENGVSLCAKDHLKAEQTVISCEELRYLAGITVKILPPGFDSESTYDKWGNEILPNGTRIMGPMFHTEQAQKMLSQSDQINLFVKYIKYPRTPHLPWSEKATDDDKKLSDVDHFIGKEVIASIKMDGENTTMYDDKIHARSINSDNHPSRNWVKGLWASTGYQIPTGWRICGENMYALHTIPYQNLESYFLVFSIWDGNRCLDWATTVEWCKLLELKTVPVFYRGIFNQELIHSQFPKEYDGNQTEGYVIRLGDEFQRKDFETSIAKFVSNSFVIDTTKHWQQGKITPNKLKF